MALYGKTCVQAQWQNGYKSHAGVPNYCDVVHPGRCTITGGTSTRALSTVDCTFTNPNSNGPKMRRLCWCSDPSTDACGQGCEANHICCQSSKRCVPISCPAGSLAFSQGSHCCQESVDKSNNLITYTSNDCKNDNFLACPNAAGAGAVQSTPRTLSRAMCRPIQQR